jgi:hypothetical protein
LSGRNRPGGTSWGAAQGSRAAPCGEPSFTGKFLRIPPGGLHRRWPQHCRLQAGEGATERSRHFKTCRQRRVLPDPALGRERPDPLSARQSSLFLDPPAGSKSGRARSASVSLPPRKAPSLGTGQNVPPPHSDRLWPDAAVPPPGPMPPWIRSSPPGADGVSDAAEPAPGAGSALDSLVTPWQTESLMRRSQLREPVAPWIRSSPPWQTESLMRGSQLRGPVAPWIRSPPSWGRRSL